ncbi:hypothetical protein CBG46_10870 [Actinobacillus succinogenes]|uniref:Uncharacterized protein n=1 Tax=Actinobacillus succinogenes (strain ATCC 55618 / DSM 22257 / CCUG 43843 / 130Z) TaxID=339671 RepID=A6VN90_ACTSZ|nr:hypothetical protein [Actinobacillus succinogenes]ABR74437.1 conserved hypothetical protein [Actinobacillus succinogenes 130Z]PHI41142.1 hypothetical protein CBG46_10870 [Actinobacillus succinogenes]
MSEEKTSPFLTALWSAFPVILFFLLDYYGFMVSKQIYAVSQFGSGIFVAEILALIVFIKGQICNGQRSRLIRANQYLGAFWLVWLALSCWMLPGENLLPVGIAALGFMVSLIIQFRQFLIIGIWVSGLGIISYIGYLLALDSPDWLRYNPVTQALVGVILVNILLVVSSNRLQGFISLLPFIMAILLALNVIFTLTILDYASNVYPVLFYFLLHLVMMGIIALHVLRKIQFGYNALMILLFIAASLPIWTIFFAL